MPTLPPEVLTSIFEVSVPPATFESFPERSSNLRAFALVCSGWRQEAQRLLWKEATIRIPFMSTEGIFIEENLGALKRLQDRCTVRHWRLSGRWNETVPPLSAFCSALTRMTLERVHLDSVLLYSLKTLQCLALTSVTTFDAQPTAAGSLATLTDLSLAYICTPLPSSLLSPQLPRLARLAIHASDFGEDSGDFQYPFGEIVNLQPKLDFFTCKLIGQYCRGDLGTIADKTLFDIDHPCGTGALCFDMSAVKHVRITASPLCKNRTRKRFAGIYPADHSWDTGKLERLIKNSFPQLETIVAPAGWQTSDMYEATVAMLEEHKVDLVFEDELSRGSGESLISQPFREHLRRKRAVANS